MTVIPLTTGSYKKQAQGCAFREIPAEAFLTALTRHRCGQKDGPWYVAGQFRGNHRCKENLVFRQDISIDLDDGTSREELNAALAKLGYRAAVYSTYNHRPDCQKWRIAFLLDRTLPPEQWLQVYRKIADRVGLEYDRSCADPARLFFTPRFPEGPALPPEAWIHQGKPFITADDFIIDEPQPLHEATLSSDSTSSYGQATLHTLLRRLAEAENGSRNNELNSVAFEAGQLIGGGELDRAEAEALLMEKALEIGLEPRETAATIRSGITAGVKRPRLCPFGDSSTADEVMSSKGIELDNVIDAAFQGQKGCASLYIKLFSGRFCFDHASGQWYQYGGHYWVREDIGTPIAAADQLQALSKKAAAELYGKVTLLGQQQAIADEEDPKIAVQIKALKAKQKAVGGIIGQLNTLHFRKQVVEFAAQGPKSLGITGSEWDTDPWTLACANGIVNLRTGELKPGTPKQFIKSPCPTAYNPAATCPQFKNTLTEIFNDDMELIAFVKRVFGMALIGDSFQKQFLIVLCGQGRNGKDTLVAAIGHVLGQHLAGPIAPEMLLDGGKFGRRSSAGPSPDIMRLRGLRLAWASETSQGRRFDAGKSKMLSGGGAIVGREPYGRHEIEFQQSHVIFLLTNHRPHAPVDDYAFWKRIRSIPFEVSFVDDPQAANEKKVDRSLPNKLKTEAPGILRWLVEGCREYQELGLNAPETVMAATRQYQRDEDTVMDFLEENCEIDPDGQCSASMIYRQYKRWSEQGGMKPMSQTAFGRDMGKRFNRARDPKNRKLVYDGLRLLNEMFEV